jgi:uncharacterized protein (TIGR02118 family)
VFSYFLTFVDPDPDARLADNDREKLATLIRRIPGLARAHLLVPAVARDRYIDDGPPPLLTIQLYFERLEELEQAAAARGALQALPGTLPPSLSRTQASQQVMWTRRYPTPPLPTTQPPDQRSCSFLVHYPGEPRDLNEWLTYYLNHHPPIMRRFPGLRELEIHTRVDWIDALPWQRVHHFQRNKIVFDSAEALERALHSPVRDEMKADRGHFPPFTGGNVHHPMATETVLGPVFQSSASAS